MPGVGLVEQAQAAASTHRTIQQGIRGIELNAVWLDEAGDIPAVPVSPVTRQPAPRRRIVDPLEIICRRCKAPVGKRCTDRYKHQDVERKPHYRRKADAQLVQQAARALTR